MVIFSSRRDPLVMDSGVSYLPFRDLEIFKEQTARSLGSLSPEAKVSELTQADKDAETVLLGTLRSHLNELHEALSWQYATMQVLYNQPFLKLCGQSGHMRAPF